METKVEVELNLQIWYGRVMKEADRATGPSADPRCDYGHRIRRGEDYIVLVRPGGKSGATLCLKSCRDRFIQHLGSIAEASGKIGSAPASDRRKVTRVGRPANRSAD